MKWLLSGIVLMMAIAGLAQDPKYTGTVEVSGRQTYYEVYGSGEPLFLLHGFTRSAKSWIPYVDAYSNDFEVYLVDLMGHGRSGPFTETISVRTVAQNLLDLILYLNLDSINAIGYSYGGESLFQLALLRPGLIKTMVIVGSCGTWNAKDFPQFVEYLSFDNIDNLPWMWEHQEDEHRIRNILEQVPHYAVTVTDNELKSIAAKTLIVVGDSDTTTPFECLINAKTHMPNCFLWVAPNADHRVHMGRHQQQFLEITRDFLTNRGW